MTDALKAQVKRKLNISWDDADTEDRLTDIIMSAEYIMRHKLGIADDTHDFAVYGEENELFLAYCLYEWSHAADEFDANYANLIAQTRAKYEVEQNVNDDET